ncbi:MAG: hypothetical protein ACE5GA_02295 [Candidatus Zixiibacteriota bacterium]
MNLAIVKGVSLIKGSPHRVAATGEQAGMGIDGRLNVRRRVVLTGASLALLSGFIFPLWRVSLEAPQYPEGLGMYIWINTITGQQKHDLQKINGLNHYIGMKEIIPESIPELTYMPLFLVGLVFVGIAAGVSGYRKLAIAWLALFTVLILAGLVDFYIWEYNYGHNLNPRAAIKIPNMTYQPPLLGSKKLLNFTAVSLPAIGGILMALSFCAGVWTTFDVRRLAMRLLKSKKSGDRYAV